MRARGRSILKRRPIAGVCSHLCQVFLIRRRRCILLNRNLINIFRAVLLAACASLAVYGQATSGNIIGTVTDPAGAVVPGVKITITSQDRGVVYNTTTNESGNYSQLHVLPGPYTMEFVAAG